MAISCFRSLATCHLHFSSRPFEAQRFITTTVYQPQFPVICRTAKRRISGPSASAIARQSFSPDEDDRACRIDLRGWIGVICSVFPGGNWWRLSSEGEVAASPAAEPITAWNALRRMWELIGDHKWTVYVAVCSLAIAAVSEISMPSILAASVFSAQRGETAVFRRKSLLLVLLCLSSGICSSYSSGLRSGFFAAANAILVKRLRESLYLALIFQDISFFDSVTAGVLTSRLGADCQRLSQIIGSNLHLILRNGLQGVGAMIALLTLSWPLALSALAISSILSVIFVVYGRFQRRAAKVTQEFTAGANEVAQETLCLMRTIRAYGTERSGVWRYKQWLDKLASVSIRESVANGLWIMSFNSLYRLTQVTAVVLGGMAFVGGHLSMEQLTKYVLYCEWLIYATWRIVDNLTSLMQSIGANEEVFKLLDMLPSDQFISRGVKLQRLLGNIQFVNVSFQYLSRAPLLDHMCLCVEAGEVVAIVGLSGSGKSTLISLLLRLYEPTSGEIYIDGYPLRQLDIRWLREQIGFVGQEPHLFHMDIKSNITYGCQKDIRHEDIEWAAQQAYANQFISSLPLGYETIVDDNMLSGGQKQRIAIARAILRRPKILILDEATSALDSESENYIMGVLHSLRNEKEKRTIIIIAHRLSTVKTADRIVVMNNGQVIEMGDHDELCQRGGLYAHLVKRQTEPWP